MANPAAVAEPTVVRCVEAIARCASCAWSASMTGDTDTEVQAFLRALLLDHVKRLHPTRRRAS
jgi:hypothetical protein